MYVNSRDTSISMISSDESTFWICTKHMHTHTVAGKVTSIDFFCGTTQLESFEHVSLFRTLFADLNVFPNRRWGRGLGLPQPPSSTSSYTRKDTRCSCHARSDTDAIHCPCRRRKTKASTGSCQTEPGRYCVVICFKCSFCVGHERKLPNVY